MIASGIARGSAISGEFTVKKVTIKPEAVDPADVETLNQIRDHLASTDVRLPGGDRLTPQRLQYLGLGFGMVGGYETVHYLLEQAWRATGELSDAFLLGVETTTSLTVNPLFALMHEAIYCQGYASNWSAVTSMNFPQSLASVCASPL